VTVGAFRAPLGDRQVSRRLFYFVRFAFSHFLLVICKTAHTKTSHSSPHRIACT
jgi:hypothetical protein